MGVGAWTYVNHLYCVCLYSNLFWKSSSPNHSYVRKSVHRSFGHTTGSCSSYNLRTPLVRFGEESFCTDCLPGTYACTSQDRNT